MLALEIENLFKTYKNGVSALQGINLTIQNGDFFALLGPNGAGKSTFMGIVTSLVKKTYGKVKIYGYDIDLTPQQAKMHIGLMPQDFNLNPNDKITSILIKQAGYHGVGVKIAKARSESYLKKLGLWEKRNDIAKNLSGGQKRRLMLARALIHQPKLLVLDEPTSGVDIETRRSIWHFLKEINRHGTTIILTTHYLEEAENLCKHIAIIDKGELITHSAMNVFLKEIQRETIVLYLEKPLGKAFRFQNFSSRLVDPTTLEVYIAKEQSISDLFQEISHHSLNVLSFRNKTNRLEELFLRLTTKDNKQQEAMHEF